MFRRVSAVIAAGLTVDVGSRIYDSLNPHPNGIRSMYTVLPTRALSRAFGSFANSTIPEALRSPLFGAYGRFYGVNFDEMQATSVKEFRSFNEFFTRQLKQGARSVAASGIVSPVDGKVMACGLVEANGLLPTVKDFRYRMSEFLGQESWPTSVRPGNALYQIVIYLAPGDYHGFHSPDDFQITERRHFAGLLLPVAPWMLAVAPKLFEANERVVLLGQYGASHLPMSYTAVGATNVGSVDLKFDPELKTNQRGEALGIRHDKLFQKAINIKRGQEVGFFRMGSTVVMIFEAEKGFAFNVKPNDTLKLGQRIN